MVQLPVPQPAAYAATGNVPLAAGCLAAAARIHGLDQSLQIETVRPEATDALGDSALADHVARDEPEFVGISLYLWNTERSLHLAREIKRRSPRTTILVGGPEVGPDNPFVLHQQGFDIAVTGEAEPTFAALMARLIENRDPSDLPGVAVRQPDGRLGPFAPMGKVDFPLADYPSPYLDGTLAVDPARSTYLETVRGCKSHCTFCFYPRSSNVLRTIDVASSSALVRSVKDRGARDVVFLDPTFNHRPEFVPLLDALADVNHDRQLSFFAEVRAEGLTADHAKKLAAAGFDKLEIGLQSVNKETLKRVRRGGSPEKVAAAAKMLHDVGIELLVDLIVGLPGDTPDDVARGIDFLLENGLGDEAQVFPLSLLPGTPMRATAEADGVAFNPAPPYRLRHTATMSEDAWRDALLDAETRLDRRLDEYPRPHLVDPHSDPRADPPDTFVLDLDDPGGSIATGPGARHAALWIVGSDPFRHRERIFRAIDARLAIDPYATLDVVIRLAEPTPITLFRAIRRHLDRAAPSYLSRVLAHRGEDLQRRLVVVLPAGRQLPAEYLGELMQLVPVYQDVSIDDLRPPAFTYPEIGVTRPNARITDPALSIRDWKALAKQADPEAVAFAHRALEARWQAEVLAYGQP